MTAALRVFAVARKEFLQLRRDRLTFGMIVGVPLLQLLMFGYAINTDVRGLRAAWADEADTHLSRRFIADLAATQVVDLGRRAAGARELERLLDSGAVSIGVYIPPDFDRRILGRERPAGQLLVDGTDPVVLGVAERLNGLSPGFDAAAPPPAAARPLEVLARYNPERRSAVNIVPGLIGVILTMTMVLFTAVAIVRERERGNLELLINTPVRSAELMLGKICPYILIGLVQLAIILALGRLLFQVPVRGALLDVLAVSLLFIAANLALGLLLSTAARTQFQAMQMTFFILLPSILLSGFMFPFDGMPPAARHIAELLPLTHFNRLIRGVMLRGAGIGELWAEALALGGFLAAFMLLAVARFSKRLD